MKPERKEVRVATQGCHQCHKKGYIVRNCRELPISVGEARVTHIGKQASGLPGQSEVDVTPKGCTLDRKRYAYRGILHPVCTIYGDSVEVVCDSKFAGRTAHFFQLFNESLYDSMAQCLSKTVRMTV